MVKVFDKVLYLGEEWVVTFINGGMLSLTSKDGKKKLKCHYSLVDSVSDKDDAKMIHDVLAKFYPIIDAPCCYEHKFNKTLDFKIVREKFSRNMGSEEFPDMEDIKTDTIVQKMVCKKCGVSYWHPLEVTDTF